MLRYPELFEEEIKMYVYEEKVSLYPFSHTSRDEVMNESVYLASPNRSMART